MKVINGHEKLSELIVSLHTPSAESWLLPVSSLAHLLHRFLAGEISAGDIETLADSFEMNEAVNYEQPHEQKIAEVLFFLSNPEIHEPLTRSNAATLIQQLTQ